MNRISHEPNDIGSNWRKKKTCVCDLQAIGHQGVCLLHCVRLVFLGLFEAVSPLSAVCPLEAGALSQFSYILTDIHTYIHIYILIYVHKYMHGCMHACVHIQSYIETSIRMYMLIY